MISGPVNTGKRVAKQGWVYKKGGNHFLSKWRLKWFVLFDKPIVELHIYDKRDHAVQATHPKHLINPENTIIEVPNETINLSKGLLRKSEKILPFIIITKNKKYYFAGQTKLDREEWIKVLQNSSASTVVTSKANKVGDDEELYSVYSEDTASSFSGSAYSQSYVSGNEAENGYTSVSVLSIGDTSILTSDELNHLNRPDAHLITAAQRMDDFRKKQESSNSPKSKDFLNPGDKWNEKYQQLISITDNDRDNTFLQKNIKICELVGAFQEASQYYGRKIIDELHSSSNNSDSIDSSPKKYLYGEIFFQFATDYENEDINVINAEVSKTNQELKAINAINKLKSDVCTALFCLVDYKGFRLVACALMPLDENNSLLFDLTSEEHKIDNNAICMINEIGNKLNLKDHQVILDDSQRITINLSGTVEVYYSQPTNKFYFLNLCDVFPVDCDNIDDLDNINVQNRLRPEFIKTHKAQLCSDVFSEFQMNKKEVDGFEADLVEAGSYLKDVIIPQFVSQLDDLQIIPLDSEEFTNTIHENGINVRYLGLIAKLTKLPYIRDFCYSEMVARTCKHIFNDKLRKIVYHFKSIEASKIDEEIQTFIINLFQTVLGNSPKAKNFWKENIEDMVNKKFNSKLDYQAFQNMHKPMLFMSMQYHCGVIFEDTTDYDFKLPNPFSKENFIGFSSKVKTVNANFEVAERLSVEEKEVYDLGIHFSSLGSKLKLSKNNKTAMRFLGLAKYYNSIGKYEEAKIYGNSALNLVHKNHAYYALILECLMETCFMHSEFVDIETTNNNENSENTNNLENGEQNLQDPEQEQTTTTIEHTNKTSRGYAVDENVLDLYNEALDAIRFHLSEDHIYYINIHSKLSELYVKCEDYEHGYEVHNECLEAAYKLLGKNHQLTAKHVSKVGNYLLTLKRTDEAIQKYLEAIQIFEGIGTDVNIEVISIIHHSIADAYFQKDDVDNAIVHSMEARKLKEKCFGQYHPQTVNTYRQLAKLVLANYTNYQGVITPQIKKSIEIAINCYERVFKYLKSRKDFGKQNVALLTLIRTLIGLKFKLFNTRQREILRNVRQSDKVYSQESVRDVILKLVHLTPVIVIDEILQKLEDKDESSINELGIIVQIAESEDITFA
ncbi:PH-domain-containing protein [Piromyces finnis]|uniref:PH-domain-containing protein n=1 Tax=Piromyces finnis TaxID=1754191 RepID=A0A1Y1VPQ4_9FUNG|nr:PH-domain-containing protein [Piromyces finnis]|eukprot:ORX60851.1 PH-domain-containing protein [Piromyces finnis]